MSEKRQKEDQVSAKDKSQFLEESRFIDGDRISEIKKSRKRAWIAAGCGFALGVGGLVAATVAFNRPIPDPVVYAADKTTGAIERLGSLDDYILTLEQADNEYWINRYINNREGYNYSTIQSMYDMTVLLSAPNDVQRSYAELFSGEDARDKKWGAQKRRTVSIRSIQHTVPGSQATVRFSTQVHQDDGKREPRQYWVATLSYEFIGEPMEVQDRWRNPAGFQVTAYRVDPELSGR